MEITESVIEERLTAALAASLKLDPASIERDRQVWDYGLDSLTVLDFIVGMEDWLDRELPMEVVWQHPTIASLGAHLAEESLRNTTPGRHPDQ